MSSRESARICFQTDPILPPRVKPRCPWRRCVHLDQLQSLPSLPRLNCAVRLGDGAGDVRRGEAVRLDLQLALGAVDLLDDGVGAAAFGAEVDRDIGEWWRGLPLSG